MTHNIPNHTALKEWAAVIRALLAGDQIVLLRKGGIADASFGIEAQRFYLFPTNFHQGENQFKPEFAHHARGDSPSDTSTIEIHGWAEVVSAQRCSDLERLMRLDPFVVFTHDTIRQRYRFRVDQSVQVMVVRAWRLPQPVAIENRESYAGCRSWLSVDDAIDITGSISALSDGEFRERRREIENVIESASITAG